MTSESTKFFAHPNDTNATLVLTCYHNFSLSCTVSKYRLRHYVVWYTNDEILEVHRELLRIPWSQPRTPHRPYEGASWQKAECELTFLA